MSYQKQPKAEGTLYVIAAPSGAGKTSLVKALLESIEEIEVSVSHTTRDKRPGEVEGLHYHFVDVATFQQMVAEKAFIEHAEVFGNFYGTSKASLQQKLDQGIDVILEIDWQGARQVREQFPECVSIFILPPSRLELEARLRNRGQDSDEVIAQRMQAAISEISHFEEFDYLLVNDVFKEALRQLKSIVTAHRLLNQAQMTNLKPLLADLLAN